MCNVTSSPSATEMPRWHPSPVSDMTVQRPEMAISPLGRSRVPFTGRSATYLGRREVGCRIMKISLASLHRSTYTRLRESYAEQFAETQAELLCAEASGAGIPALGVSWWTSEVTMIFCSELKGPTDGCSS